MSSFATRKDVTGYQFRPAPITYRDWTLRCVDVSVRNSFGYDFELRAGCTGTDEQWLAGAELEHRRFARGVTLHFTDEPNKLGWTGCFSAGWFRDDDVDRAITDFRAAVDAHIAAQESVDTTPTDPER